VQERGLAGVVQAQEEQLCVFVEEAEGGENVVDWEGVSGDQG
jgi:hypothetical protein